MSQTNNPAATKQIEIDPVVEECIRNPHGKPLVPTPSDTTQPLLGGCDYTGAPHKENGWVTHKCVNWKPLDHYFENGKRIDQSIAQWQGEATSRVETGVLDVESMFFVQYERVDEMWHVYIKFGQISIDLGAGSINQNNAESERLRYIREFKSASRLSGEASGGQGRSGGFGTRWGSGDPADLSSDDREDTVEPRIYKLLTELKAARDNWHEKNGVPFKHPERETSKSETVPPSAADWLASQGLADLSLYWPTGKPLPQIDYESGEAQPTLVQLLERFLAARASTGTRNIEMACHAAIDEIWDGEVLNDLFRDKAKAIILKHLSEPQLPSEEKKL